MNILKEYIVMKRLLLLVILLGSIAFLFTGCSLVGSGPIETKEYQLTDFTEIEISHDFNYDITRSETYSVVASTHQNLIDHLDIFKSGQTLKVRLKSGTIVNSDARVTVTLPALERLQVSGAASGHVSGFSSGSNFTLQVSGASQSDINMETGKTKIQISGASRVNGTIKAAETEIVISGASNCDLSGSTAAAKIEISGASHADLPDLILQNADIELSGASGATINTSGKLDMALSGASTLNYYGKPMLGKVDISGASQMHQK
jgi:hypothetical protein